MRMTPKGVVVSAPDNSNPVELFHMEYSVLRMHLPSSGKANTNMAVMWTTRDELQATLVCGAMNDADGGRHWRYAVFGRVVTRYMTPATAEKITERMLIRPERDPELYSCDRSTD